jgi:hypothetical protein
VVPVKAMPRQWRTRAAGTIGGDHPARCEHVTLAGPPNRHADFPAAVRHVLHGAAPLDRYPVLGERCRQKSFSLGLF